MTDWTGVNRPEDGVACPVTKTGSACAAATPVLGLCGPRGRLPAWVFVPLPSSPESVTSTLLKATGWRGWRGPGFGFVRRVLLIRSWSPASGGGSSSRRILPGDSRFTCHGMSDARVDH